MLLFYLFVFSLLIVLIISLIAVFKRRYRFGLLLLLGLVISLAAMFNTNYALISVFGMFTLLILGGIAIYGALQHIRWLEGAGPGGWLEGAAPGGSGPGAEPKVRID